MLIIGTELSYFTCDFELQPGHFFTFLEDDDDLVVLPHASKDQKSPTKAEKPMHNLPEQEPTSQTHSEGDSAAVNSTQQPKPATADTSVDKETTQEVQQTTQSQETAAVNNTTQEEAAVTSSIPDKPSAGAPNNNKLTSVSQALRNNWHIIAGVGLLVAASAVGMALILRSKH